MSNQNPTTADYENEEKMIKVHDRCGTPVSYKTVSPGYTAECLQCDEDLYSFEISEVKDH